MNFITVTSDNYAQMARTMVESLRVWYPSDPVIVYALDTGWTDEHAKLFDGLNITLRILAEQGDTSFRGGASGSSVFAIFKLDAFVEQTEPFIFLDADTLVLGPLTEIIDAVTRDGWFTVHEGTTLAQSNAGEVGALSQLQGDLSKQTILNSGVLGCDPARYGDVFKLALDWGRQIKGVYQGDQGLINVAWYKLHGHIPPDHDKIYNGGWLQGDRIVLTQRVLHFARANYPAKGRRKVDDQAAIWSVWPRGVALRRVRDELFWRESLPHPWPWLNQCVSPKYAAKVRAMRDASDSIADVSWLVVDNEYEAHLLSPRVRKALNAFWREHASRFTGVPHVPTYHMAQGGKPVSAIDRFKRSARLFGECVRARLRS
jgi:hypothetical protein